MAIAVVVVCAGLAGIATIKAAQNAGKPFPGFIWQQHGDLVAISVMTSSSWDALNDLRWGAIVQSVDGYPPTQIGAITSHLSRRDTYRLEVSNPSASVEHRVEIFSWNKLVESFGIFLFGGLLFGWSGVFLIFLGERQISESAGNSRQSMSANIAGGVSQAGNLTRYTGAALLVICVLVLSGLAQASVTENPSPFISIIADILWAGALSFAGPVFLLLAAAVSPGLLPTSLQRNTFVVLLGAVAAWPFCFLLLRTSWGLEAAKVVFLYLSAVGLIVLAASFRTLTKRRWVQSPTHAAAFVVSVPLTFTLLVFVTLAAIPWALGREFVLPSSVMIPVGCLTPITLVYSSLAGVWLTGLKVRATSTQAMLERQKITLASMRLLLHDHVLADMKALRGDWTLGTVAQSALSPRLLGIENELRGELANLDSDRAYNVPEGFPAEADIRAVVSQLAPGAEIEIRLDSRSDSWPPLVRWLFFCHIATLIRNARIHGRAESIRIEMWQQGSDAVLIVEDDGLGFGDVSTTRDGSLGSIGLRAAQRDIEEEGGLLRVARSASGGARIEERLPLPS